MFNPRKDFVNPLNPFVGIQEFGGSAVLQEWQRSRKPVRRLMLVTEDTHSVRYDGNDADDR